MSNAVFPASAMNNHILLQAIEATRSAIIITDCQQDDDPIIYCNKAFQALTGYSEKELLGTNCRILQGEETDAHSIDEIRQGIKDRRDTQVIIKNYRKDGSAFWNDLIVSPVLDDSGKLTHFIGLQLDVTERKEYEDALAESRKELVRSNKELEQFTYAASHDLQEPLRMVTSYLGLIERRLKGLDQDTKEFIGYATEGATRMQILVNDLLSLSRIRTRAKPFEDVSLEDALATSLLMLKKAIEDHNVNVTHDALPIIKADETQIIQLIQSLISNAVKYRDTKRRPNIHIGIKDDVDAYILSVRDNGIGIDAEFHDRIFGVFQRLHTRDEYEGNGIGLTLCQKIAERHGGEMWLASVKGEGSTFFVRLLKNPPENVHE